MADRGYFAVRAFDVFTGRTPLTGPWSSGATVAVADSGAHTVYSPGPLLFWLLSVPARFADPRWIQVTAGLVNVASVIGIVALARRRGGLGLMIATAAAIPLMLASLPSETYSDIWNSSAPLLPLALLIFLAWSLAAGEYRLLPLTVVVGSFVAQTHLTFTFPAVGGLALGLAGLAAWARLGRLDPGGRRSLRRWAIAGALVAVLCWSAPLVEQAIHRPGNLLLLARAAATDQPTLGWEQGWHGVVHTIGAPPWWLQGPREPLERAADLSLAPGTLASASALLVLAGLAAVVLIGWRRRRPDLAAAGALGIVLAVALAADVASTPRDSYATVGYTLRWASPAGMCTWLLLGWSLVTLLSPGRLAPKRRHAAAVAVAGVLVVAAVGGAVAARTQPYSEPYHEMRTINDVLETQLQNDRSTWVQAASFDALRFKTGIVYALRRAGMPVLAEGAAQDLGGEYEHARYGQVVDVSVGTRARPLPSPHRRVIQLAFDEPGSEDDPARAVVEVFVWSAGRGP